MIMDGTLAEHINILSFSSIDVVSLIDPLEYQASSGREGGTVYTFYAADVTWELTP